MQHDKAWPRAFSLPKQQHKLFAPSIRIPSSIPLQSTALNTHRPIGLFSEIAHLDSGVQLSSTHDIGFNAVFEAFLQGSKLHLAEFRLRLVKTLASPPKAKNKRLCQTANLALGLATDFQCRRRVTLESTMGTQEDEHTLACAFSSDFMSKPALGLATSHRLGKNFTLFSRYSRDGYAGERFILQAVHELNARNKVSALYATTIGHHPQAGFSWIHNSSNAGDVKESFLFKALGSGDGSFTVSIKAQVGSVD